jgi:hypothetical protein
LRVRSATASLRAAASAHSAFTSSAGPAGQPLLAKLPGPQTWTAAPLLDEALAREDRLGYVATSGRYWDRADSHDIDALDRLWLEAVRLGAETDAAGPCAATAGVRSTSGRGHDRTW